jgi:hypothetical protein
MSKTEADESAEVIADYYRRSDDSRASHAVARAAFQRLAGGLGALVAFQIDARLYRDIEGFPSYPGPSLEEQAR